MKIFGVWKMLCLAPRILPDSFYEAYEKEVRTPCIMPPSEKNLPEVVIIRNSISTVPAKWKRDEDSKT